MKIVAAFDSFKGCLTSLEAARAAREGIEAVVPGAKVLEVGVADGGEGTVDALAGTLGGRIQEAIVSDPLGRKVKARCAIAGRLGIIEAAQACGLTLLKEEERNPLLTTSKGLGELILDAISRGCNSFIIGLGGSATNDGGRGMIEVDGFLEKARSCSFTVACDVDNPFIGPNGASRIFAPQKGASPADVEILEQRLAGYAQVILSETGVDVTAMPGAGAAGGLGGAFAAYLSAELKPGVEMVLDAIGFDKLINGADLILTGEGRSDSQTAHGKAPAGILRRAQKLGIPVALVSGAIDHCPELDSLGFASMTAATPESVPLSQALTPSVAKHNLRRAVQSLL